jgi:hypothetical protein
MLTKKDNILVYNVAPFASLRELPHASGLGPLAWTARAMN